MKSNFKVLSRKTKSSLAIHSCIKLVERDLLEKSSYFGVTVFELVRKYAQVTNKQIGLK